MAMFDKKSGDSKRQDGEKARSEDQRSDASPEEKAQALPALVQDAADKAKENGASPERVAAMERMIENLTQTVEKLQSRVNENATGKFASPEALLPKYIQCGVCGQYQQVCKGKHTTVYVVPSMPEYMEGFQGVTRNGVRYFGTAVVPTCMADSIKCDVLNYETYKRRQRYDLGKMRGWDREIAIALGEPVKQAQSDIRTLI